MTGRADTVRALLAERIEAGATPSAQWWVGRLDEPVSRGTLGRAAVEPEPEPAGDGTVYDLASLTKPLVTALLAILLERERKLSLGTSLGSVFSELRGGPYADASLRDAALHRARFPAWAALYLSGATREDYVRAIAAAAPAAEPGATLYSDLGYLLLGFAVERAGGAALDRLFEERVARPLGLARCGFPGRSARFAEAAATERGNGYERRLAGDGADPERFRTGVIRGAVHDGNAWGLGGVAGHAGLFGTAADVARIASALLEPRRLGRPRGSFDPMFEAPAEGGERTVGFLRATGATSVREVLPAAAVGHFGFTGTSLWIDRAAARIYVLLTNRVHPEVPPADFAATRREFHRAASARLDGST